MEGGFFKASDLHKVSIGSYWKWNQKIFSGLFTWNWQADGLGFETLAGTNRQMWLT